MFDLGSDLEVFKKILNTLPNSIYLKDLQGRYVWLNKASMKQLEYKHLTFESIIGKTDFDVFPMANAAEYAKNDRRVIETKQGICIEEDIVLPNGEKLIQLSFKEPLYNGDLSVAGVLGYTIDITEIKRKEEEIRKEKEKAEAANKAKTEFLENMRHDIRTPLTGIIGFSRLIKEETKDSQIAEYSDNMLASSQALLEFLNEILETIRVTSGEIPLLKKKFDLKDKLQSVFDLLQVKAHEKKLSLTFNYDKNAPHYLIGDFKRVHRIFLELIANAINFTHQGEIKISATLAKQQEHEIVIKLVVSDTGVGIPEEKKEEIFVRFNRLTPSYKGIYKGAGLGLTIVKQFIDDLSGEIYVESEVSKGSTFTCFIPFKKALIEDGFGVDHATETITNLNVSEMSAVTSLSKRTKPKSKPLLPQILLVEDQIAAAKAVEAMLRQLGCAVDIAMNGQAALTQIKKQAYDLIFIDVGLPDISGNEITHLIRKWELAYDKHTPILALTAHVETEEKQACIEAGMDAVLSKPLLKETAIDILNAFIPKLTTKKVKTAKEINKKTSKKNELLQLSGTIIDLEFSTKMYNGNIELAKEMLQMLVDSFPDELLRLKKAHQKQDWKTIQAVAHKLRGGAGYCGTPRLLLACGHLENYLKEGSTQLSEELYQQLLKEIQDIQKQAPKVLKK